MKNKLIEILKERGDISFTLIPELIPEARGELAMFATPNPGFNENVILLRGINKHFITIFNMLYAEKIVSLESCSVMIIMWDGAPVYGDKICTKRMLKGKSQCWMPMLLKKGENFPKL